MDNNMVKCVDCRFRSRAYGTICPIGKKHTTRSAVTCTNRHPAEWVTHPYKKVTPIHNPPAHPTLRELEECKKTMLIYERQLQQLSLYHANYKEWLLYEIRTIEDELLTAK